MMQIEVNIVGGFAVWRRGVARQTEMHPDVYQPAYPFGSSQFMPQAPKAQVTIDCSNELDMDFLNASSERDAKVAVSIVHTASRVLPDDVSNSDLGLGLYDQRHDGTWWPSF